MKILDDLISSLKMDTAPLTKVLIGLYTSYVENTDSAGLSSTLMCSGPAGRHSHPKGFFLNDAGKLHLKSGQQLCQSVYSDVLLEASIGMAAINSYVNAEIKYDELQDLNASQLILDKGENKNVAVIGNFPFISRLRKFVKNLYVFELLPKDEKDLPPSELETYLPVCDVVAITGTTLLNHTLDDILNHTAPDAYKIMLGPSTPMSPVLLDFGFDALCGSYVIDKELTVNHISQAVPFKKIQGVKHLTLKAD